MNKRRIHQMRGSNMFFIFIAISMMILLTLTLYARREGTFSTAKLAANAELVKSLRLTDLCLFTEARYTRHPSMADLHSPFQDHPFAMDHFPSGSLVNPPRTHFEAP